MGGGENLLSVPTLLSGIVAAPWQKLATSMTLAEAFFQPQASPGEGQSQLIQEIESSRITGSLQVVFDVSEL